MQIDGGQSTTSKQEREVKAILAEVEQLRRTINQQRTTTEMLSKLIEESHTIVCAKDCEPSRG